MKTMTTITAAIFVLIVVSVLTLSITVMAKTAVQRQQEIYTIVKADIEQRKSETARDLHITFASFNVDSVEATKKIFEKETLEAVEYTPEQIKNEVTSLSLAAFAEEQKEEPHNGLSDLLSSFSDR